MIIVHAVTGTLVYTVVLVDNIFIGVLRTDGEISFILDEIVFSVFLQYMVAAELIQYPKHMAVSGSDHLCRGGEIETADSVFRGSENHSGNFTFDGGTLCNLQIAVAVLKGAAKLLTKIPEKLVVIQKLMTVAGKGKSNALTAFHGLDIGGSRLSPDRSHQTDSIQGFEVGNKLYLSIGGIRETLYSAFVGEEQIMVFLSLPDEKFIFLIFQQKKIRGIIL